MASLKATATQPFSRDRKHEKSRWEESTATNSSKTRKPFCQTFATVSIFIGHRGEFWSGKLMIGLITLLLSYSSIIENNKDTIALMSWPCSQNGRNRRDSWRWGPPGHKVHDVGGTTAPGTVRNAKWHSHFYTFLVHSSIQIQKLIFHLYTFC